jgi:hypothetical protein
MFFYVDESGNTGLNLNDNTQPYLYYGVLSSPVDLDSSELPELIDIRKNLSVTRIHANEIGYDKLSKVYKLFIELIEKYNLKFDLYKLNKRDYIVISFFDQVFDQGLNPAVPWNWYWTPLRYPLLFAVSSLFDDELIVQAWEARITRLQDESNNMLKEIIKVLLGRAKEYPDMRAREIISNALFWAFFNIEAIQYRVSGGKNMVMQISPNLIGFQSVIFGILGRSKLDKLGVDKVIVDQQAQFNNAQKWLASIYQKTNDVLRIGPGLPEIDLKEIFKTPIECVSGYKSNGLEIVDIFLWLFKRWNEGKEISKELKIILFILIQDGMGDEISINALYDRWGKRFSSLPELSEYSEEHLKKIKESKDKNDEDINKIISDLKYRIENPI